MFHPIESSMEMFVIFEIFFAVTTQLQRVLVMKLCCSQEVLKIINKQNHFEEVIEIHF